MSTAIRVRIGDTVLTARLRDVPASRDLIAQLPLDLTFRDFNNVEKISQLPRKLSMDGVPAGDDPEPRDVGYYAPSGNLVFYYGDVGYYIGIVRLGQFDGSVDAIESQKGEFTATVEARRPDMTTGPGSARPAPEAIGSPDLIGPRERPCRRENRPMGTRRQVARGAAPRLTAARCRARRGIRDRSLYTLVSVCWQEVSD